MPIVQIIVYILLIICVIDITLFIYLLKVHWNEVKKGKINEKSREETTSTKEQIQ